MSPALLIHLSTLPTRGPRDGKRPLPAPVVAVREGQAVSCNAAMRYATEAGGDRATFLRAGNAAEKHAELRSRGKPAPCVRNRYRHFIPAAVCVADYRDGAPECARDGGCSVGRALDKKLPKEIVVMDKSQTGYQDPDLPEDMDRPFILAGIEFTASVRQRVTGKALVAIKSRFISLRTGVIAKHGLDRYAYARLAASRDGKAIAIKFYREKRDGAAKLQGKRKGGVLIAAEAFLRNQPQMIGQEAPLESAGIEGWYVIRLSGEAA